MYGERPATFGANVFDAGLLLEKAIPQAAKSAKPGTKEFRSALRDALENTHELVATQGVYNMSPEDHSGFDDRGRVLLTVRSEEHTSELQSLMRISYAVFCLKKKTKNTQQYKY